MRKWKMGNPATSRYLAKDLFNPFENLLRLSWIFLRNKSFPFNQAPVPSKKRKSDASAHRFSRAFWAGNWPITSVITRGKWWGKRLLQNHGSDYNRKSLSNPGLLYATHCLCFIFSLIWDPGTELKSGLPGWFVRAELAVLFETGWKGLEKEDCLLMVL